MSDIYNKNQCSKQAFLVDVSLTFPVAPKDYKVTIAVVLRRFTGTIPKLLVSINDLHIKTSEYRTQFEKHQNSPLIITQTANFYTMLL